MPVRERDERMEANSVAMVGVVRMDIPRPEENVVDVYTHSSTLYVL